MAVNIERIRPRLAWSRGPRIYRYRAWCVLSAYGAWSAYGFTYRTTAERLNRLTARILAEG